MPDSQFLWFIVIGFFAALAFRTENTPMTPNEVGRRFILAFIAAMITKATLA